MEWSTTAESAADAKGVSAAAGIPDDQISKMEKETSDNQLYKQAGNGVTVNVIEAIGRNLKAVDEEIRSGSPVPEVKGG